MNWIKARLNRDNFINLMFWFGMFVIHLVIHSTDNLNPSGLLFWSSLVLIPYIIRKCSKLTYKDKTFFNSKGESLKNRYPKAVILCLPLSVLTFIAVWYIVIKPCGGFGELTILDAVMTSSIFLGSVLYFIYKNCPIAILFYYDAWCPEVTSMGLDRSNSGLSTRNDPAYSNLSSNDVVIV